MKRFLLKSAVLCLFLAFAGWNATGQPPPPSHGEEEDQPAPVGGGLTILLAMGAAYGAKKVYDARKKLRND